MGKWAAKFSGKFDEDIWNIYALDSEDSLLIETRDANTETVNFFEFSFNETRIRSFRNIRPPWFSQVVYVNSEFLLIQQYDENLNPDKASLILFSVPEGNVLWQIPDLRFEGRWEHCFVCTDSENNRIAVDIRQGNVITDEPGDWSNVVILEIPVHYMEGTDHYNQIANYLNARKGQDPVRAIDYLEGNGSIVLSYYTRNGKELVLQLMAMDESGNVGLEEILAKDLKGIADPPFLFCQQNLIFVKEKRHFFVYALPKK